MPRAVSLTLQFCTLGESIIPLIEFKGWEGGLPVNTCAFGVCVLAYTRGYSEITAVHS